MGLRGGGLYFGMKSKGCGGDIASGSGRFGSGTFGDQQEGPVDPAHPCGATDKSGRGCPSGFVPGEARQVTLKKSCPVIWVA